MAPATTGLLSVGPISESARLLGLLIPTGAVDTIINALR